MLNVLIFDFEVPIVFAIDFSFEVSFRGVPMILLVKVRLFLLAYICKDVIFIFVNIVRSLNNLGANIIFIQNSYLTMAALNLDVRSTAP